MARQAEATLAAADPARRALYADTFTRMIAQIVRRERNGSPPDVAAETIVRALTAARPRDVYRTGKFAHRMAALSLLPTPVLDTLRRRLFGLPAPGSFTGPAPVRRT